MILTIALTLGLIAILFLMILTATLTLPSKALTKTFPKDVQESLAPRLDNLPMSAKRIFGIVILIILGAAALGIVVTGGVDGIKRGYDFGQYLLRFLIMFIGLKIFDVVGLDYFLLSKSHFFQHFFPETENCAGWKNFGFNRKQQLRHCIAIPIYCAALAGIFTLTGGQI
ncbi:MAG: hypothetical protein NC299_09995 [Lachnospiraceae bacterium]|nr:hypothetical protein [Ruminococcus sp.]MCM1275682.1 hypothetical protein [Lachnospiraceae bacterium]